MSLEDLMKPGPLLVFGAMLAVLLAWGLWDLLSALTGVAKEFLKRGRRK
jgi:hypothetical protein